MTSYFGIKAISSSGHEYWFKDEGAGFSVTEDVYFAKIFLTKDSASRFLKKFRTQLEDVDQLEDLEVNFIFEVWGILIQ